MITFNKEFDPGSSWIERVLYSTETKHIGFETESDVMIYENGQEAWDDITLGASAGRTYHAVVHRKLHRVYEQFVVDTDEPEIGPGDTVRLEFTISESDRRAAHQVWVGWVDKSDLTLVKKAIPLEPPVGSVIALSWDSYIRTHDGWVDIDLLGERDPAKHTFEELVGNGEKFTVVFTP